MNVPPEEPARSEHGIREMPDLQAGLLRRSMRAHAKTRDRCAHCDRSPLAGEQIFVCRGDRIVCELCISLERNPPRESRLLQGPEVGQTIRILDRRSSQTPLATIRATA